MIPYWPVSGKHGRVLIAEGYCWSRTSERQVRRIRRLYLQAMLRQETGFFDSGDAAGTAEIIGGITTKLDSKLSVVMLIG